MLLKKTLIIGWIGMAALAVCTSPAGADVFLRFKDDVLIMSRTFDLGDIADLDKNGELSGLTIGRTPRPGQSRQVTQFEISSVLEKARPGLSRRLRWRGPATVRIRGGGVQCDLELLRQSALRCLRDHLEKKFERVDVSPLGNTDTFAVSAGKVSFHPKLSQARPLAKRMPVWVDVRVGGQHYRTVPVWFAVSVRQSVWVVQNKKAAKEPILAKDAFRCVKDIAGLGAVPLMAEVVEGHRSVRELPVGRVLTVEDAEPMPAVCQGDRITVFARHGGVEIQIKAVAMADGRVSEQIAVRNPGSGQSFRAMVTGNRQARVN